MLRIVTFKWKAPQGYLAHYTAEHVNVLRNMVERHYPDPHEFVCVTDDPQGLDKRIRVVPLWNDFSALRSPLGPQKPSCYRRLKLFAPNAAKVFGKRFVCIDIDTLICGDMRPLWNCPEEFRIWGDLHPKVFYNGSMWILTAGKRSQLWTDFHPTFSPKLAHQAGFLGSDQAWIGFRLGRGEATWGVDDGVFSYRVHIRQNGNVLPAKARVVFFHGNYDPWSPACISLPWVREHWR